jgi:hypothetical protein
MNLTRIRPPFFAAAVVVLFSLSGCSFASETLWPSLTGEDPSGPSQPAPAGRQPSTQAAAGAPPPPAEAEPTPPPAQVAVSPAPPPAPVQSAQTQPPRPEPAPAFREPDFQGGETGTFTGQKVTELRAQLNQLQSSIGSNNGALQGIRAKTVQDSQNYHATVAAISARLQVGTTPGNPVLVEQFNQALSDLEQINEDIGQMNKLTSSITSDSTLAAFLSENTRAAFRISGAVDEDHRQLAILEDEVNRTSVLIDRLLKEISADIARQTSYLSTERSNLNLLAASVKNGEILGASLANRALGAAFASNLPGGGVTRSLAGRRPLVVIRFDRADVAYEQALYNAISRTLERQPSATFELVAVAPAAGGQARVALNTNTARRNAENVLRALRGMGLPSERVSVSAQTSGAAQSNEVHLYVN